MALEFEKERMKDELALERWRAKVEQVQLKLKEGKACDSLLASRRSGSTGSEVAGGLRLLPKFDEKDLDTFFACLSMWQKLRDGRIVIKL